MSQKENEKSTYASICYFSGGKIERNIRSFSWHTHTHTSTLHTHIHTEREREVKLLPRQFVGQSHPFVMHGEMGGNTRFNKLPLCHYQVGLGRGSTLLPSSPPFFSLSLSFSLLHSFSISRESLRTNKVFCSRSRI